MNPGQVIEKVRTEILDAGRDSRYRLGAYAFVLNGLEFYLLKIGEKRHVSGQEFARGLAEFAAKQFGPLALDVLQYWGVHTTGDFGAVVYNLISIGLMCKQDGDSLDDFSDVFDLSTLGRGEDSIQIDKEHIRSIGGA